MSVSADKPVEPHKLLNKQGPLDKLSSQEKPDLCVDQGQRPAGGGGGGGVGVLLGILGRGVPHPFSDLGPVSRKSRARKVSIFASFEY